MRDNTHYRPIVLFIVALVATTTQPSCQVNMHAKGGIKNKVARETTVGPINNHADSTAEGSLASWAARAAAKPGAGLHVTLTGPHEYSITADLTIPENLTLTIRRGAILAVAEGATLTINAGLEAGPWRIFARSGRFAGKLQGDFVRPQWWGRDHWALQQAVRFGRVHLGRGRFTIDQRVLIGSDTHLSGEPGCLIISTRRGLNLHEGMFSNLPVGQGSSEPPPVRNVTLDGIRFKNTTATGIFALALFTGDGQTHENIRMVNCEVIGGGLANINNVKNIVVRDNYCHSSTLALKPFTHIAGDFVKYDNHNGIYLGGGVVEDAIITHNRILGPRCHGIAVVAKAVYNRTYEEQDPDQDFPAKRILIQGNEISAPPNAFAAAGIFAGYVQDCRVIGNHVQNVNDTAIDFEGSRNCLADSNIIVNGGKCLAMWGNNKNVTFSNNIVYLTEARFNKDSPFFKNSYSNGYDPPIIDLRSTELFVTGNTFSAAIKSYERPWAAGIVPGTARRLYIRNNNFINARFQAHFCDDLESIEITGNNFYNELPDTGPVVYLAVSERNKATKQPAKRFIVSNNRFRSVNDADSESVIQIDTAGGLEGNEPHCDLDIVIENNVIERQTTVDRQAITFRHNYDWGFARQMKVKCVIRNNVTNAGIDVQVPAAYRDAVQLIIESNAITAATEAANTIAP